MCFFRFLHVTTLFCNILWISGHTECPLIVTMLPCGYIGCCQATIKTTTVNPLFKDATWITVPIKEWLDKNAKFRGATYTTGLTSCWRIAQFLKLKFRYNQGKSSLQRKSWLSIFSTYFRSLPAILSTDFALVEYAKKPPRNKKSLGVNLIMGLFK